MFKLESEPITFQALDLPAILHDLFVLFLPFFLFPIGFSSSFFFSSFSHLLFLLFLFCLWLRKNLQRFFFTCLFLSP